MKRVYIVVSALFCFEMIALAQFPLTAPASIQFPTSNNAASLKDGWTEATCSVQSTTKRADTCVTELTDCRSTPCAYNTAACTDVPCNTFISLQRFAMPAPAQNDNDPWHGEHDDPTVNDPSLIHGIANCCHHRGANEDACASWEHSRAFLANTTHFIGPFVGKGDGGELNPATCKKPAPDNYLRTFSLDACWHYDVVVEAFLGDYQEPNTPKAQVTGVIVCKDGMPTSVAAEIPLLCPSGVDNYYRTAALVRCFVNIDKANSAITGISFEPLPTDATTTASAGGGDYGWEPRG